MNICPHCGADILDSATMVRCSSCGSELGDEISVRDAPGADRADERESKAQDDSQKPLDDSAPINPDADLELVQSGHAFWAEAAAPATAPPSDSDDTEPEKRETLDKSPDESSKKIAVAEAERSNSHAPSLADLARARREQLMQEMQSASTESQDAADHQTNHTQTGEPTQPDPAVLSTFADESDPSGRETRDSSQENQPVRKSWSTFVNDIPGEPASQEKQPEHDRTMPVRATYMPEKEHLTGPEPPAPAVSVARAPDIAFLEGNSIYIPGTTWSAGENVVIQGRTFQLKRPVSKYPIPPKLAAIGAACMLFGLIVGWMMTSGDSAPSSVLFGMIQDAQTGHYLPGVTIAVEDGGRTAQSDPTGMFYLDGLKEGIYTLVATDPIYGRSRQSITVSGSAAGIIMEMEKQVPEVTPVAPPQQAQNSKSASKSTSKPSTSTSQSGSSTRGELAVTASVSNAKIYIDGKTLGVGNSVYAGIRPGKRTIRVVHEGFDPWEKTVTIEAGKTTRIEPVLATSRPPEPQAKTPDQYAAAGLKLLEARQYKQAVEQFDLALKGAQRAQYYAWRADAYAGMKETKAAEADYLRAVALFAKNNEDSKLDDMLSRAVLVVPGSADLRMSYGDYLYRRRKLGDAQKQYQRALEQGADPVRAYVGIGLARYAGGSFEDAERSWNEADALSGEADPHLAGYLALVEARLQHRASCRNYVRRITQFPDILQQFRSHPDWSRVQHPTGEG